MSAVYELTMLLQPQGPTAKVVDWQKVSRWGMDTGRGGAPLALPQAPGTNSSRQPLLFNKLVLRLVLANQSHFGSVPF